MRKTIKRNKYFKWRNTLRKRSRGSGIGASKPIQFPPPLPPSPPSTPRNNKKKLSVLTNEESLIAPKPGSNKYEERKARLLNMKRRARTQTFMNVLMGREPPKPELNMYGYPKSAFTVNNKVGFSK